MADAPEHDQPEAKWNITNICEYVNQTKGAVTLINHKDHNDNISIDAYNSVLEDVHVPWADSQHDFMDRKQRLELSVTALNKKYYIWQSGDKVRYSTNGTWSANAFAVPGFAQVGGLRKLFIRADGSLYLESRHPN